MEIKVSVRNRQVCNCGWKHYRSKKLLEHLKSEHGYSSIEEAYVSFNHSGIRPTCKCGCGKETSFSGWNVGFSRFKNGHNANIYIAHSAEDAAAITESRRQKLTGRVGWSAGLTKESSVSLARAAEARSKTVSEQFANGRQQWSKGLTKETDGRVAAAANQSVERFRSGEQKQWHSGHTKETHSGLLKMSKTLMSVFNDPSRRKRLDGLKRLDGQEVLRRIEKYASDFTITSDLSDYVHYKTENLRLVHKKCGTEDSYSLVGIMSNRCKSCDPAGSLPQLEVSKYINSLGFQTDLCSREIIAPYEIDIEVLGTNLCVEFNGLYFHSELFKHYDYHSLKSRMASEVGRRLIHIFDDEWANKRDIVKSMIAHRLGVSQTKFMARKGKIRELTSSERRNFFESNHIDGDVRAMKGFGIVVDDVIVAAISLRKPFHKKYVEHLEVARFCTQTFASVQGALGRLTRVAAAFAKNSGYKSLLTYVDNRHGVGDSYLKVGYEVVGKTANRFWWTDTRTKLDRFKVRADSRNGLTERDVANQLGVVKVFGCPNTILKLKL